ncbi:DUF1214 domain-containing protein [Streptomyces sp. NPDC057540]|uniref:DUF1214 domain-containing protein n=1 Tax=Streptomyces sp. NPDC057540 TaxID=3346160 RepID=UPI0036A9F606
MSDIQQQVVQARAFEAAVWGMPAVNYRLMYEAGLSVGMKGQNQLVWWPGRMSSLNQSLTPNPDVVYLMAFYDTTEGPVVLEIPAAAGDNKINGSVMNYWQAAIEDVGPAGYDAGAGATYLILPPYWPHRVPAGYIPLRSDTVTGYALLRSIPADDTDASLDAAVTYAEGIKFYPFTTPGVAGETARFSALDKEFDSKIRYDASFFTTLNTVVQSEPWLDRDRVMIDQLASLGIVRGSAYTPDDATLTAQTDGIRGAQTWLEEKYRALYDTPYYEGTHWTLPALPELVTATNDGFADTESYPVDERGVTFTFAFFSSRHLGKGQSYLTAIADANGADLDGSRAYTLHIPAGVPIKQYWSLTAYQAGTHTFMDGAERLSRSSLDADLTVNEDGSVDLYLASKAPEGKNGNWIQTSDQVPFEVMFRLYGPTDDFTNKKNWTLPDIQPL